PAADVRRRHPRRARHGLRRAGRQPDRRHLRADVDALHLHRAQERGSPRHLDPHPLDPAPGHPRPEGTGGLMDWGSITENSLRATFGQEAVIYALAAIGLNLHFGYTGLLNFGQVAFMAVGAYAIG